MYIWAGISKWAKTGVCIFSGNMDAVIYYDILRTLLPFLRDAYPEVHKLFQDNDPKHMSCCAKQFIEDTASTGGLALLRVPTWTQ